MVELAFKLMVLLAYFSRGIIGRLLIEELGNIDRPTLWMGDFTLPQLVDASDHFVHGAKSKFGHQFPNFVGDETHVVDQVSWFPCEFRWEPRVLRGDTYRASIAMAFAQHDAAQGDQRRRAESIFFSAEQCRDNDVPSGLQPPVCPHPNA